MLRPGVRHSPSRRNVGRAAALLTFFPLRGVPTRPLGRSPPLIRLGTMQAAPASRRPQQRARRYRVSIRSGLG
jgi:hypothetical protein